MELDWKAQPEEEHLHQAVLGAPGAVAQAQAGGSVHSAVHTGHLWEGQEARSLVGGLSYCPKPGFTQSNH